jgi:uncharacterized protein (TIGR02646 family)
MHTVTRGPEPARLKEIRKRLTPKWVRYYQERKGKKPSDTRWRDFQPALSAAFFSLCAYCEGVCKGEVDHFRPKSRFPELVYQWSNWVLACHTCNEAKQEKWPRGGYVNPCARSAHVRPEAHFDFDTKTAEVVAKPGGSRGQRRRALATINDLRLNEYHHLKARMQWLKVVESALATTAPKEEATSEVIAYCASRERAFSSITRKLLQELGYRFDED